MRVWLIKTGETLPCDGEDKRRLRTGLIAESLIRRGHDVVWWSSTFDHITRKQRFSTNTLLQPREQYQLWLLRSPGYQKNFSTARLWDHYRLAREFQKLAPSQRRPDVILCSMPTIENGYAATRFGSRNGIPVVLDVRDMWPEIIVDRVPKVGRPLARILLEPKYNELRTAARRATALTGITDEFVDWAVGYANRSRSSFDRAFPLAYSAKTPRAELRENAFRFWRHLGVGTDTENFPICFFGSISHRFELSCILRTARIVATQHPQCQFVICGDGEALPRLKKEALGLPNVIFPGWIDAAKIWTLLRLSKIGIAPYPSTRDFTISVPNKVIEYLSAGLPVATSLSGTSQRLLESNDCGVRYENNSEVQLAREIGRFVQQTERLEHMSWRAKALFKRRFVAEKVYDQMCEYLELIASRQPAACGTQSAA